MRLIDADALCDELFERLCSDCEKRKGVKSGKWRIIYNVGDAPCRACEVDDMKAELEDAPTVDAVPVVRCGECVHHQTDAIYGEMWCDGQQVWKDHYCSVGERKSDMSLPTDNSNRCVCCGAEIPEGRMVCPTCERRTNE